MSHRYRAFGLVLQAEMPLPELQPAPVDGPADVTIRRGGLPPAGPGAYQLLAEGEVATLWVEDANATYRMTAGRSIIVDSRDGEIGRNVRLYLLGSALGAVLHQRGLLPLHACALAFGGKAIAMLGRSGAGKSTLAAWLADRGGGLLSDDVCVVEKREKRFLVPSGIPRLRLWRDALEARGEEAAAYARSFDDWDKFDVPVPALPEGPVELAALFLLEEAPLLGFDRLSGAEAVEAVSANTYRGSYVRQMDRVRQHFDQCVALVREVPVIRFTRPRGFERMDESNGRLLERIAQLLG